MPEVAIFARYLGSTWAPDNKCKKLKFEPIMRAELNFCDKHKKRLYFDGPACPCCGLMRENFVSKAEANRQFLALTAKD